MRLGIRYQLLLPLLTLMLGMAGMTTWTALSSAARARRQIATQMEAVAQTVQSVTFPRNVQTLHLMKGFSGADFLIVDARHVPLEDDQGKPLTTLARLPERLPRIDGDDDHPLGRRIEVGGKTYFLRVASLGHDASPNLHLYILYSESLWRDALWESIWPGLFVGLAGGVLAALLTIAVTQRVTRRILQLERRTRLIAAGDFSPMPLPHRNDELRDLGQSVNEMAQQLAAFQDKARQTERLRLLGQVSGGLAHQLRNGVAGAKLSMQLFIRENPESKDAEALQVALRQLALVETHLKRFLDLGKAAELRRQPCDLRKLVGDAATLIAPQCKHAGIELRQVGIEGEPLPVNLDADQFGHLILNLLTNAMEAAGPGGWVEVEIGRSAEGNAALGVRDSGPGPAAAVADRLFEPFVTGKREGVGLGLAVAKQVVEAHGGSIAWRREGDTTRFDVDVPIHTATTAPFSRTMR